MNTIQLDLLAKRLDHANAHADSKFTRSSFRDYWDGIRSAYIDAIQTLDEDRPITKQWVESRFIGAQSETNNMRREGLLNGIQAIFLLANIENR